MTSYSVAGVTDCFEGDSFSINSEEDIYSCPEGSINNLSYDACNSESDSFMSTGGPEIMPEPLWVQVCCNEEDNCAGLEGYANSLGIQSGVPGVDGTTMTAADQYCIKCQAGSWPDDMAEMCDCCDTDYTYSDNVVTYDDGIEAMPTRPGRPTKDRLKELAGIKPEEK